MISLYRAIAPYIDRANIIPPVIKTNFCVLPVV
jgi:hypothetical protein